MIYTQSEKEKIELIMELFDDYIKSLPDYEIFYSDRLGYIWVVTAERADNMYFPIRSRDELLCSLISYVLCDAEKEEGNINTNQIYYWFADRLMKHKDAYIDCAYLVNKQLSLWRDFRKIYFPEDPRV